MGLAGAERSRELQVGLQPAIDLDRCIAGAEGALALRPIRDCGKERAENRVERLDNVEIHANEPQAAGFAGVELRR
jgi:hypothetical protein